MRLSNDKKDIELIKGKLGTTGFEAGTLAPASIPLGPSLGRDIPAGCRMLFVETSGCPNGWTKVTGVDGYHLQVGDVANAGNTQAAASTSHKHDENDWKEGGGATYNMAGDTSTEAPTLTYPSIKYLLCEKD